MRILYVEDNPFLRSVVVEMLAERGWETVAVESVPEARRELRARAADVVIADHHLQTYETGADLLREVASQWPQTRRILVSASEIAVQETARLGAAVVLLKPFDVDELVSVILGTGTS